MKNIGPVTESEMVAHFLKTEIESLRFRADIVSLLERLDVDPAVIDSPDLLNIGQSAVRARLLGEWRGYRRGKDVFTYYPENPAWHRYEILREELPEIRYINDDYWIELSGGSRRIGDAARNIREGIVVFGQSTEWALNFALEVERGARFPEPILVGMDEASGLTVLEGHARMTAYVLALNCLPSEITAIVGFDPGFARV